MAAKSIVSRTLRLRTADNSMLYHARAQTRSTSTPLFSNAATVSSEVPVSVITI
jgi:hypothetical protein